MLLVVVARAHGWDSLEESAWLVQLHEPLEQLEVPLASRVTRCSAFQSFGASPLVEGFLTDAGGGEAQTLGSEHEGVSVRLGGGLERRDELRPLLLPRVGSGIACERSLRREAVREDKRYVAC